LKKIIPVPNTLRKYSNLKIARLFFITEDAKISEEKPKTKGEMTSQSTDILSANRPILRVFKVRKCRKRIQ